MKELIWDDSLSVQIDEIDDDHQKLVDLFNILNRSVEDKVDPDYIEAVLDELLTCTIWHFKHEERLMIKYSYKGYQVHKAEHQDLIESAIELQRKFKQEGKSLSTEDIEFLEHWLSGHILSTDMDLGSYLASVM